MYCQVATEWNFAKQKIRPRIQSPLYIQTLGVMFIINARLLLLIEKNMLDQ